MHLDQTACPSCIGQHQNFEMPEPKKLSSSQLSSAHFVAQWPHLMCVSLADRWASSPGHPQASPSGKEDLGCKKGFGLNLNVEII